MDCLYETFTVFSFEEYKKFVEVVSNRKRSNILLAVVSVLLLVMGIVQKTPLLIVLAIAYPFLAFFSQKMGIKKSYQNAGAMHDARVDYRFYEKHFVKVFDEKEDQFEYEKLFKVLETETNFYLMLSKTQGFVLVKANMPDGMVEFVKNGLKK